MLSLYVRILSLLRNFHIKFRELISVRAPFLIGFSVRIWIKGLVRVGCFGAGHALDGIEVSGPSGVSWQSDLNGIIKNGVLIWESLFNPFSPNIFIFHSADLKIRKCNVFALRIKKRQEKKNMYIRQIRIFERILLWTSLVSQLIFWVQEEMLWHRKKIFFKNYLRNKIYLFKLS